MEGGTVEGSNPPSPRGGRWRRGGGLAALLLLLAGGCTLPDPLEGLPGAAVSYLDPVRSSMEVLSEGVIYRSIESAHEPWTLHLLEVDTDRCEVGFQVVGLDDPAEGRRTVLELAQEADALVLAAVNGDFFTPENEAIGLEARGGELRRGAPRPVFAWRPGAPPHLGSVVVSGDTVQVGGWWLVRGDADGETELVAGFPRLLEGGMRVGDLEAGERPAFSTTRHPRTALGWDEDLRRLWVVVVDGRREGISEGMTLDEMAGLFEALGVEEALNLDGGGSSTMVLGGRVASRPSDPAGPRPVVNALVIREDPALCQLRP